MVVVRSEVDNGGGEARRESYSENGCFHVCNSSCIYIFHLKSRCKDSFAVVISTWISRLHGARLDLGTFFASLITNSTLTCTFSFLLLRMK
jgi:hypothetical protein